METILVPTDFSETADNALDYAIELAKLTNSKLILLHAYHLPIQASPDLLYPTISEAELERINKKGLQNLEEKIKVHEPDIKIELLSQYGLAVDVIIEATEKEKIDLIIMGISEAGTFGETIIGSNAVDVIRRSANPVLIVPSKAKYKKPEKIVFATDYLELKNNRPISLLLDFVAIFKAKLFVVNVVGENEEMSAEKEAVIVKVEKLLEESDHSIHHPVNQNIVEGLNEFISNTAAEIIAMISHKHNVFYSLLNLSSTKKMAFHTKVPLLALPENLENTKPLMEKKDFTY
jgi:nucleotide-binding universal stress UspA family protein